MARLMSGLAEGLPPGTRSDGTSPGAALPLGRADFHGRWVDWTAPPT